MSELKATTIYDAYWKANSVGEGTGILVYLKSEADKVIAHHKYKRCLAMAKWCHNESLWWYSKGYGFEKYDKFWEKWEKRWLELAEKFKEAK